MASQHDYAGYQCFLCHSKLLVPKTFKPVEAIGAICHFTMYIASIIILAALAKWGSSKFVWETLVHDKSGWTDPPICWGIGFLTVTVPLTGKPD